MERTLPRIGLFLLLLGLAAATASDVAPAVFAQDSVKALVGGRIIDGFGGKPIENGVIVVDGERIVDMGTMSEVDIPAGAEIISTEGMSWVGDVSTCW